MRASSSTLKTKTYIVVCINTQTPWKLPFSSTLVPLLYTRIRVRTLSFSLLFLSVYIIRIFIYTRSAVHRRPIPLGTANTFFQCGLFLPRVMDTIISFYSVHCRCLPPTRVYTHTHTRTKFTLRFDGADVNSFIRVAQHHRYCCRYCFSCRCCRIEFPVRNNGVE